MKFNFKVSIIQGLVIIALACFGLLCLWQGQYSLLILIFVLVGVTLGFWLFNRPQASIFMGDSGSMFLGYVMALLSIWVTDLPGRGPSALPLLILAVPILDTGFALFRRFFKGIPFYSADKELSKWSFFQTGSDIFNKQEMNEALATIYIGIRRA